MAVSDPGRYRDRTEDFMEMWHARRRAQVRALVTDELLAEHYADPEGEVNQHSGELVQVLNYVRTIPTVGKDFAYMTVPFEEYRIGLISPRGAEVTFPDDDRTFATVRDAVHARFIRRLVRFGLLDQEDAS